MTGKEFKIIRKANVIKQQQIALKVGKDVTTVRHYERSDYMPSAYVVALQELSGLDLSNSTKIKVVLEEIPDRFHNPQKRRSLWHL